MIHVNIPPLAPPPPPYTSPGVSARKSIPPLPTIRMPTGDLYGPSTLPPTICRSGNSEATAFCVPGKLLFTDSFTQKFLVPFGKSAGLKRSTNLCAHTQYEGVNGRMWIEWCVTHASGSTHARGLSRVTHVDISVGLRWSANWRHNRT